MKCKERGVIGQRRHGGALDAGARLRARLVEAVADRAHRLAVEAGVIGSRLYGSGVCVAGGAFCRTTTPIVAAGQVVGVEARIVVHALTARRSAVVALLKSAPR
jgi:hypothetical protein